MGEDWYKSLMDINIKNVDIKARTRTLIDCTQKINTIIDRNEFFIFDDNDYKTLQDDNVEEKLLDNVFSKIGNKVYNIKKKYEKELKDLTGNYYNVFEKIIVKKTRKIIEPISNLLSIFPENNNEKNKQIYNIIKDFYNDIMTPITIQNLSALAWKKSRTLDNKNYN